jgi:selenide,water dikinase
MIDIKSIKLTAYTHGAGCRCKIAPSILDDILKTSLAAPDNKNLIVGNSSKDDAAVYDLGNGTAIITTTDFFMPIVDDPFTFGKIAGANAISDVYAMGGKPLVAIAILGWPVDKLPAEVAQQVIEGARSICAEAGIPLAGGHSIDNPEPIFGLAVTGITDLKNIKTNNGAIEGDSLILTKPLGIGVFSTAQKRGLIDARDYETMVAQLVQLNSIGEALGKIDAVHALTDVTGFGLLGHLVEMCEGSGQSAELDFASIPLMPNVHTYLVQNAIPGGTKRNWNSYGHKVHMSGELSASAMNILADPQTNGGLLISVAAESAGIVQNLLKSEGLFSGIIGHIVPVKSHSVLVN